MAYEFTNTKFLSATCPVSAYPFTIAGWFNISGAAQDLFLFRDATSQRIGMYVTGNTLRGYINQTSFQESTATGSYTNNVWFHACFVCESSTLRTIYRDGGNSASSTNNQTPTITTLRIGNNVNSIVGSAADCAVWNTALTAAEVASLAKGFSASLIQPGNLVFHAPLIRDLNDISGGAAITNNGTATVSIHPRIYGL